MVELQGEFDCIACQVLWDGDGCIFEEDVRFDGWRELWEVMPTSSREVELVDAHFPSCESSLKIERMVVRYVKVFEDGRKETMSEG